MIPDTLLATRQSRGQVWRIVESQEQAATRRITRSAAEQSRLEELLDAHKPAYLPGSEQLHWLLRTPFRYPPLRHGSRFGTRVEPGILYASRERETAMTESAVYLWLFRAGPLDTGPLARIADARTAIHFGLRHRAICDLTREPGSGHRKRLSDPADYSFSQALGARLRETGAGGIWFHSARAPHGVNAAILSPAAIPPGMEPRQEHWQLHLDARACWWGRAGGESFEIPFASVAGRDGRIPHPCL
ncbi:RES domain-containing protein [Mangrovimicrobium sediminis]|uniref:RES domain-containing protein n=1 Tax=Mangrovimicrobium sediminis TaxID=2562682 RepID=A0A4Z0M1H6_9GAMM|nr:RES family NAD+ phosphorylase [Haliea sp. SAOS-164]TGD73330.1 RES domain-containing protein [Haliea sp. SAOS-164]